MSERRLTMHNGRTHRGGKVFSAKHNEHLEKNGNWDTEKREDCYFWKSRSCPGETFDEGERNFYEKNFRKSLDLQNERHKKSRHLERVKSMDDFRKSKNFCPEETLFYLGDKDNFAPKEELLSVIQDYVRWHTREYPLAKILDFALHADEAGAPHVQLRKVWMAKDSEGNWAVGQNRSLEQMGVKPPRPDEKIGAKNNAKITYTEACREKLFALCRERGIELETEPRPKHEQGLSLSEFLEKKAEKSLESAEKLVESLKAENEGDKELYEDEVVKLQSLKRSLIKGLSKELEGELNSRLAAIAVVRQTLQEAASGLTPVRERVQERTSRIQAVEPSYTCDLSDLEDDWER